MSRQLWFKLWNIQGFFFVFSGAQSQWNLGDYFPILKKIPIFKKKNFFFEDLDFHSVTTHTSYMVTPYYHCIYFSFNLMAKVCVIANLFFY